MKDSENRPDSGNDENGSRRQTLRGEAQWQEILRGAESETARFLGFYAETFSDEARRGNAAAAGEDAPEDRLDRCALEMGWCLNKIEDEDGDAGTPPAEPEPDPLPLFDEPGGPDSAPEFPDAAATQALPECIAATAVFCFARSRWDILWKTSPADKLPAATVASLAETLASARHDVTLAADADAAGDFGLAICLAKKAHAALNVHFSAMGALPSSVRKDAKCVRALRELRCALMDLRDICLRILFSARHELEKTSREDGD